MNWKSIKDAFTELLLSTFARNSSARKNCSTPKSRLLDTVRADFKKIKNARKSKKRHFEQMRVLDQNEQLLELQLLDKSIEKCQLLKL